jgi:ribosomal protein S18 acetylase RimI-like enzyme
VQRRAFFEHAVAFELEVTGRNTRARALYERLGFVPRKNASLRLLRP